MSNECILAHAIPDVPQFARGITSPTQERPLLRGERQTHDVTRVALKCRLRIASLYVPQSASQQNKHMYFKVLHRNNLVLACCTDNVTPCPDLRTVLICKIASIA